MENITYHIAPPDWTPEDPNPFTADGYYGSEWSCLYIWEGNDHGTKRGRKKKTGLLTCVKGRGVPRLAADLADYIRYEFLHGRQCIISIPPDMGKIFIERALAVTPEWSVIRSHDPKWIVHSTTVHGWAAIQACGELKSQARLHSEGVAIPNHGSEWFGEPEDYTEYIIMGDTGAEDTELVVASHLSDLKIEDRRAPYTPGARLFLDAHRLISDGLVVRDGIHVAKVYDHLPLDPYLIAAVTPADIDPKGKITVWTPRTFCLATLKYFSGIVGEVVPYEHLENG